MRVLTILKHWFIQKVLGRKPLCRCCDFVCEPVYGEAVPYRGGPGPLPVCEICSDFDPGTGKRTWT